MGLMFVFWPSLSDVGKSAFFAPGSGLISCASDCCCNGQASQTLNYLKSVFKKMAITYHLHTYSMQPHAHDVDIEHFHALQIHGHDHPIGNLPQHVHSFSPYRSVDSGGGNDAIIHL